MTRPRRLFAALLSSLLALSALAAPAPWFLWESQLNGRRVCAQASPGPGWTRLTGPFRDARCLRPVQRAE